MKHPLVAAIEARNKAIRKKSHPRMIRMLDERVSSLARDLAEKFSKTNDQFPILDAIRNKRPL